LVQRGGAGQAAPPSPLLAVPNLTAHLSMASVPITVLLYDGPLLCGFNVAIKGLTNITISSKSRRPLTARASRVRGLEAGGGILCDVSNIQTFVMSIASAVAAESEMSILIK